MLTIDPDRIRLRPGSRVLDLGCGGGRHTFELVRRGARVVALDHSASDLHDTAAVLEAMDAAGEAPAHATATVVQGDARRLPFPAGTFDRVVASEVLEHVVEDRAVIAEIARVLRPGGLVAVSVPRWWPERICWALSERYHTVEGGHVRIYRRGQLVARLEEAALSLRATHHAHALHAPYWWLKCLVGIDNDDALLARWYHRFLTYDIVAGPAWTRRLERLLDPVLGKSLVLYLDAEEPG